MGTLKSNGYDSPLVPFQKRAKTKYSLTEIQLAAAYIAIPATENITTTAPVLV